MQHRTNRHFTLATKSHFQLNWNWQNRCTKFSGNSVVTEVHFVIAKPEVPSHNFTRIYTFRHTLECFGAVVKEEEESCIEGTQDFIHWQVNIIMCSL